MNEQSDHKPTTISRVLAVGGGLFAFGVAFDRFTGWFNRQPKGEERSAFLVVIGTAVTVLARQGLPAGLFWDFFAFACSGLPMIWGQNDRLESRNQAAIRRHLGKE